jgi:hypothetical protein
MIEKKIYIAKDGTEFSEDNYPSAEFAKAMCEEYERTESSIEVALTTTIVLLDDKGNRITEFDSAFAIYCKTDEAARLLDILTVKEGYYSPWNNGLDGGPTAGYYLYDTTADEWFDLSAKIAELTNIKKSLEEA